MMTTVEVADRVGMSVCAVRQWVRVGKLRAIRIDRRGSLAIAESDLVNFCEEYGGIDAVRAHGGLVKNRNTERSVVRPVSAGFRDRKCLHEGDFIGAFCEVMAALEGVGVAK